MTSKIFLVSNKNMEELKSVSDTEIDGETGYIVQDALDEFIELSPAEIELLKGLLLKEIDYIDRLYDYQENQKKFSDVLNRNKKLLKKLESLEWKK